MERTFRSIPFRLPEWFQAGTNRSKKRKNIIISPAADGPRVFLLRKIYASKHMYTTVHYFEEKSRKGTLIILSGEFCEGNHCQARPSSQSTWPPPSHFCFGGGLEPSLSDLMACHSE